jgi:hypothetical protein
VKRYWLVILLIAIVVLFLRVKWEVKRIYVEDPDIKKWSRKSFEKNTTGTSSPTPEREL